MSQLIFLKREYIGTVKLGFFKVPILLIYVILQHSFRTDCLIFNKMIVYKSTSDKIR